MADYSQSSSEALVRAMTHWETQHKEAVAAGPADITIALSGEIGAGANAVAREIGRRLNWQVYDRELLELIAREMNVRVGLLESVDEHHVPWLQEAVESLAGAPHVKENKFVRHLVETLYSLSAHGRCVIVGRGAAEILPPRSTLRVRLVAELNDRITTISHDLTLSRADATKHVQQKDQERPRFIKEHFHKDVANPLNYDLVLNTSHFPVHETADLIIAGVRILQARTARSPRALRV